MESMASPNQPADASKPMTQEAPPSPKSENQVTRSTALIICGGVNIVLSSALLFFCIWAALQKEYYTTGFVGISSAIYHIVFGSVVTVGGKDTVRHRSLVIASLVFGIIGCCVFVVITVTVTASQWSMNNYSYCVSDCFSDTSRYYYNETMQERSCLSDCQFSLSVVNSGIILFSLIEFVIDIVISSLICHIICHCCKNKSSLGYVSCGMCQGSCLTCHLSCVMCRQPGSVIDPVQICIGSPDPLAPQPVNQMQQQTTETESQFPQTDDVVTDDDGHKLI